MSYAATPGRRDAVLDAEQRRLNWLRANPGVPVMGWNEMVFSASRDEVTAVADLTDSRTEKTPGGFRVIVRFGSGVAYVAYASEQAQAGAVAA